MRCYRAPRPAHKTTRPTTLSTSCLFSLKVSSSPSLKTYSSRSDPNLHVAKLLLATISTFKLYTQERRLVLFFGALSIRPPHKVNHKYQGALRFHFGVSKKYSAPAGRRGDSSRADLPNTETSFKTIKFILFLQFLKTYLNFKFE